MTSSKKSDWLIPTSLVLLSAIPILFGALRAAELAGGPDITPENARFVAAPLPVVLHIISVTLYCLLGAFQFAPRFRRRRRGWHRAAGRLLVPSGLIAAGSGLWMTLVYPQPPGDGDLITGLRLVFGSAMIAAIVLGFAAILRRDIANHSAWMIRGYAIGLGAGTQVLTHVPWVLVFGAPSGVPRAMLMAAGWVINVAVAEWIIRKKMTRPTRISAGRAAALVSAHAGR